MKNNKQEKQLNILFENKQHFISDPRVVVSFGSRCEDKTPTVFKSACFMISKMMPKTTVFHRRAVPGCTVPYQTYRFPLYKQHSIDATIVFWVIRHLGEFTWNTRSYLFVILRNTKTALTESEEPIRHSPQMTFPPCVTNPSSLTLTSMTVPLVMTPRVV